MTHKSTFEIGREHYLRKEYEEAVRCFMTGSTANSSACMGWLGQCYEFGLGVKKNLSYAKDMYIASYEYLYHAERSDRFGLWLSERINGLKDIPLPKSETRHIPGLGNIKVVKSKYSFIETKIRYNKDETVVDIEHRKSILTGFSYAEEQIPKLFSEWTCDGKNKFYDGYTLETDFFKLRILQDHSTDFLPVSSRPDGRRTWCHVSGAAAEGNKQLLTLLRLLTSNLLNYIQLERYSKQSISLSFYVIVV